MQAANMHMMHLLMAEHSMQTGKQCTQACPHPPTPNVASSIHMPMQRCEQAHAQGKWHTGYAPTDMHPHTNPLYTRFTLRTTHPRACSDEGDLTQEAFEAICKDWGYSKGEIYHHFRPMFEAVAKPAARASHTSESPHQRRTHFRCVCVCVCFDSAPARAQAQKRSSDAPYMFMQA